MPAPTFNAQRLLTLNSFRETVWGTPGAATARWMGVSPYPEFTPFRKATIHDEARASLAPGYLFNQMQRGGTWKVSGKLTYQDAIFLGHSIWAQVTPTGTNPYTYTYTGPLGTQPTLTTYTFEFNQTGAQSRAVGCVANKLSIKGEATKELTYDLSGFAQDIDPAWSGTPATLSDRTVNVAIMPELALFMDASGGSIGATAFAGRLVGFGLDIENSMVPIPAAGSLLPAGWVAGDKWKSSLTLKLLAASDTRTFLNATLQNPTGALLRLRSTLAAASITLDMAAVLADDIKQIGEFQGAQMWEAKLSGYYDAGAALHTNLTVVNAVSTIP